MIGNIIKYWHFSYREVLYEIPFPVLLMLGASIPKNNEKEDKPQTELSGKDLFRKFNKG